MTPAAGSAPPRLPGPPRDPGPLRDPGLAHDPLWPRAGDWPEPGDTAADVVIVGVPTHRTSLSRTRADTTPAAIRSALQDGDPLAGYSLYCVTFTDPPADGSGVADTSGVFQVSLQGGGVP
ncbi:MAG: hypothetical protein HY996_00140, partial [Micrococcales bacterium]|nr:hypothetical protein [Micrococcales bacterium]